MSKKNTFDFPTPSKEDSVNHPPHYNQGKIEVAEFIKDQRLDFFRGNAVKYIARAGKKDKFKEIEDLEKAIWYLNYEVKCLKTGEVAKPNSNPINREIKL